MHDKKLTDQELEAMHAWELRQKVRELQTRLSTKQFEALLQGTWTGICEEIEWPGFDRKEWSRQQFEAYAKGARHALEFMSERGRGDDASPNFNISQIELEGAFGEWSRRRGEDKPTRWPSINKMLNQIRDWRIAITAENKHEIWQQLRPITDDLWRWTTTRKVDDGEKYDAYTLARHEAEALNGIILDWPLPVLNR